MNSIQVFYRWNLLSVAYANLSALKKNSTGPDQALYRTLMQDITEEMETLIPMIRDIFKRIKRHTVVRDIVAIYFEDMGYQDWAETRGVSVETIYTNIEDALNEIDREIEAEAA